MKAFIVEESDGLFQSRDLENPLPKANQVVVKISHAGVNPLDTKIRSSKAAHAKQPLPAVLGMDMSGVVESIGADVRQFQPGDEVFGMVGGVGGLQGTLAEYIAVESSLLALNPQKLSMRDAAALPLVAITAWEGLVDRAGVKKGDKVLIHAGGGGVGYAAIQIALSRGAQVFTTVSNDKRSLVEDLGAVAIERGTPIQEYVDAHTGGVGFDIVYDTLGGPVLDESFVAVKRYTGHVVSCLGWGTHALAPLSFRSATYSGVFTLFPLLTGIGRDHHGEILKQISDLASKGQMKPFLSEQHFGSNQIAQAFDLVAKGSRGKVVVEI
ncbi:MAG: zinc-dependent alcohol dehydrogenase family protein [Edaphobacter sp.]